MKSTKINILGALIITISVIIVGISGSYAYFVNAVKEVNPENKGVVVRSGPFTMNFETTQTITANSVGLINDSDIATKANYTAFDVTLPSDSKVPNASYNLFLTDIKISQNFKSSYLKWALYNGTTEISHGDFNDITLSNLNNGVYDSSNIQLVNDVDLAKGNTNSYKLYIWLSYDANNQQNDLLQGSLSAKVGFRAVTK